MVRLRELFLFLALFSLAIFFIYIYNYITKAEEEIFSRVEANKIKQVSYLFKNIAQDITLTNFIGDSKDLVDLFSNEMIRKEYEKNLSLLATPSMKYIYMLSRDEKGRFRFLLDASKTDRANFYQKFDVDSSKYTLLYETGKSQVIKQHDMENLYLTYLHPIVVSNKVIGILSVDITTKIHKIIAEVIGSAVEVVSTLGSEV